MVWPSTSHELLGGTPGTHGTLGATVGAPGPGLESLLPLPVELLERLELKEGATEQKLISFGPTKQKGAASQTPSPRMYPCPTFPATGLAS